MFNKTTPTIKIVGAYTIKEKIIIHSSITYKSGLSTISEPIFLATKNDPTEVIGNLISKALSASQVGNPDPIKYENTLDLILNSIDINSNRKLQQQSVYCIVEEDNNLLIFTPTHNGGTKGRNKGFLFLPDKKLEINRDAPTSEIGSKLIEAIHLCTSIYPIG